MKVFVFVFLIVGATAAGSGPYLPSGWKPEGPSFNLPGETQNTLREYGAPNEEPPQDLTKQEIPSISVEYNVIDANINNEEEVTEAVNEEAEVKIDVRIHEVEQEVTDNINVLQNFGEITTEETTSIALDTQDNTGTLDNLTEKQLVAVNSEVTSTERGSGNGFLEYGPPGFSEYGPPEQRSEDPEAVVAAELAAATNDVRKRRFSSKFKLSHKA